MAEVDPDFVKHYVEKLVEENQAILKEKVILRAQVSLLAEKYQALERAYSELAEILNDTQHKLEDIQADKKERKKKAEIIE